VPLAPASQIHWNFRIVLCIAAITFFEYLAVQYYFSVSGTDIEAIKFAMRSTARFSCLIFCVTFCLGPAHKLWANATTQALLEWRRYIGVCFASVHSVHVWLIIFLFWVTPKIDLAANIPVPIYELLLGGGALVLMYLMVATSFDRVTRIVGIRNWRRLHVIGMYSIWAIFLFCFGEGYLSATTEELRSRAPMGLSPVIFYHPFLILTLLPVVMRLWLRVRRSA